ncbi:Apolipoprotein D, partial [Stegodyphus mimosarum]
MLVKLAVLCLTATVCWAGFGTCPAPKTQSGFDLDKFMGTWYELEATPGKDSLTKCSTYVLEKKEKRKAALLHKYISPVTGKVKSSFSEISTPKSSEPAQLLVSPLKGTIMSRKWNLWVIDTDYETYAITYTCHQVLLNFYEEARILSRTKTLDDKKKMDIYAIMNKNNLPQKSLIEIDQQ